MSVKKVATGLVNKAKANPAVTLAILGLLFPSVARKVAPIVIAATTKDET